METVSFILVFIRSILYPLAAFMLLTMAWSANNRKNAHHFSTHIVIALLLFVLGLMSIVRLFLNNNEIISNLGNFVITPILAVLTINFARLAMQEERNFIKSAKEAENYEH